jgi:hypothetical protein
MLEISRNLNHLTSLDSQNLILYFKFSYIKPKAKFMNIKFR